MSCTDICNSCGLEIGMTITSSCPFKTFALWRTEGFKMLLKCLTPLLHKYLSSSFDFFRTKSACYLIGCLFCLSSSHKMGIEATAVSLGQHANGLQSLEPIYHVGKCNTSIKGNLILIAAIHLLRPSAILLVHTCKIFIQVWGNAFGWVVYSKI